MAERLSELFDIKVGDVIGICSENRLEFAISVYATILLGATVAPLNVTYSECMFDRTGYNQSMS